MRYCIFPQLCNAKHCTKIDLKNCKISDSALTALKFHPCQPVLLLTTGQPPDHQSCPHPGDTLAQGLGNSLNLDSQFASGNHDHCQDLVGGDVRGPVADAVDQGDEVGSGFTGAGTGADEDVATV